MVTTQASLSYAARGAKPNDLIGGYRVASQRNPLLAWFEGASAEMFSVIGLCPHAIWLDSRSFRHMHSQAAPAVGRMWLDYRGQRLGPLEVELCSAVAGAEIVGLALPRGSVEELRGLASYLCKLEREGVLTLPEQEEVGSERITEPGEVRDLLDFLMRARVEGHVQTARGSCAVRLVEGSAGGAPRWQAERGDWLLPSTVDFTHLNTIYQVPVAGRAAPGTPAAPGWIRKLCRRRARRAMAQGALRIGFIHPLSPELEVEGELLELSSSGASFRADALAQLLYPGLVLPELKLVRDGAPCGSYRGTVRSVRFDPDERNAVIGVALEPSSRADSATLRRLLDPLLYPSTLGGAVDVWGVFEESGYLTLSNKTPEFFTRLRAPFLRTAKAFGRSPDVATLAHWPAEGKVQATLSHLKLYKTSWMLCQVSKTKNEVPGANGRQGLYDMYLRIYESALNDPDTRWLIVYVQDEGPRWSKELHVELPRRYLRNGEACLLPFRALEVDVAPSSVEEEEGDIQVAAADELERVAVARDLTSIRPWQYLDALDLCEEHIDLGVARARWRAAGLERTRQIFVAYEGGVRVAAAVVETAAEGAHLYGLLDCLRMYPLRQGGERGFSALLRAAHGWFAERCRGQFTYLEEYPNTLPLEQLGFRDLGGASFSILAVERTPELLQRAADLASRRKPSAVARIHGPSASNAG
jgi:hypothetical protein